MKKNLSYLLSEHYFICRKNYWRLVSFKMLVFNQTKNSFYSTEFNHHP